nr:glycoside hydrolase family 76 protein [Schumannella luteola]
MRDPAGEGLDQAVRVHENILERNAGELFNDYFDDMLWFALASLRLADALDARDGAGAGERYRSDAIALWEHVREFGWNDALGASVAWRKQQPYYKNTPANGPFVILGARLFRATGDRRFVDYAVRAFTWLTLNLVDAETGFVEDGVNREQDGVVDRQWRFTYNQGLYVGAAVALAEAGVGEHETAAGALVPAALRTARTAIRELSSDGSVFDDEGDGGDEGLFKGVFYRYLGTLLPHLAPEERAELGGFVESSTDALWASSMSGADADGGLAEAVLRPDDDWSRTSEAPIHYSTLLSAVMAVELRAELERARD